MLRTMCVVDWKLGRRIPGALAKIDRRLLSMLANASLLPSRNDWTVKATAPSMGKR